MPVNNNIQIQNNNYTEISVKNSKGIVRPVENFSEIKDIELLKNKAKITSLYNTICDKLNIKENIRPQLKFEEMGSYTAGYYEKEGEISVNIKDIKNIKTKKMTFVLRHELEHLFQYQNMMRMLGLESFANLLVIKDENYRNEEFPDIFFDYVNTEYYQKVEKEFGKIEKNSPEGLRVQKHIEAYKNYPKFGEILSRNDIGKLKKILLSIKEYYSKYKTNILEKEANKAARMFTRTFRF